MTHREARRKLGSRTTRRRNTKTALKGKVQQRPAVKVWRAVRAARSSSGMNVAA